MTGPIFPGGTGVSQLTVYDWSTVDGLRGGSAHVHLACTEGYVVLGGRGRLQTLTSAGYDEVELAPETVAWFGPGVIHRLVNDGDLRILVVMQNGGLPEAGDAVLTFPPEHLADPERAKAADAQAARQRRDLAVQGFLALRERFEVEGGQALEDFYAAAAALVEQRIPRWREVFESSALAAARRTGEQLDALAAGNHAHLRDGRVQMVPPPTGQRWGMCGRLTAFETRTPFET